MAGKTELGAAYVQIVPSAKGIKGSISSVLNKEASEAGEKASKTIADKFKSASSKMGSIGSSLTSNLTKPMLAGGAAIVALTEKTRDYRDGMAKLNAAFTTNGFSAEAAQNTYKGLQRVLGDSDQAVEAANHLSKLCDTEQELEQWTTIAEGVYAQFGDSLPIEGLTEAANETAKVGQVTGPLADALNWAGISEDEFNEKLAECSDEQERQRLIMEALYPTYKDQADAFEENAGSVLEANEANEKMAESLSKLGEAFDPIISVFKGQAAGAISALADKVMTLSEWFTGLSPEAQKIVGIVGGLAVAAGPVLSVGSKLTGLVGGILPHLTKLKGIGSVLLKGIKGIPALIGFITSPIGIAVVAIGVLVAAGIALYKNWDTIKAKASEIWGKIKAVVTEKITALKTGVQEKWNAIKTDTVQTWENIKQTAANKVQALKESISNKVSSIREKMSFSNLASKVSGVFSNIKDAAANKVQSLKDSISNKVSTIKNLFSFSGISSRISSAFAGARDAALNKIQSLKDKVSGIIDKIKGFFNFTTKTPNVKVPHFSITPKGWKVSDLLKGKIPTLGIRWAAKGGIMNSPTLVGIGAGEAGSEALLPLDPFWNRLDTALDSSGGNTFYITMNVDGANDPETYAAELARSIKRRMRTV